jgi:dTDP-L-rhamnose 4-epimerase
VRVLVTGGAGFVGSHVVDRLADAGHEVRVVDGLLPTAHDGTPPYLRSDVEYLWGDLTDPALAAKAVAGVEGLSHHAGMVGLGVDFGDAPAYVANNDLATAALLRALHERSFRGPIVLASSMVVYGEGHYRCVRHGAVDAAPRQPEALAAGRYEPPCPRCEAPLAPLPVGEDAAPDPRNVYAATKVHQEHLCGVFGREHGVPVVALRYHNVYGPRLPRNTPYAGVAGMFLSALQRSEAPRVLEDGRQLRDFVHVRDVARANQLALESPVPGACNIASGTPRSVLDLAAALARAFGADSPRPEVVGGYRLGDVRHIFASADLARHRFGFAAQIDFETGLPELARIAAAPNGEENRAVDRRWEPRPSPRLG